MKLTSRMPHSQRLVRAFFVEFADEVIETCPLLKGRSAGRTGGLLLQRQMQALVAAVLLLMAGLDAFDTCRASATGPTASTGC
ncbi:hypothetical protein [Rhizobium leguminosarum]|uniref:hypothetical protein n=1 Tax=Rhizobium leguminosarum TaxID=384 RepID=UPI001C9459A3|nr:hypothetical protein [Rhizobium leguminosarum]